MGDLVVVVVAVVAGDERLRLRRLIETRPPVADVEGVESGDDDDSENLGSFVAAAAVDFVAAVVE